ncbi:MAG TPA: hypothetical protein VFB15_07310 [Candidatus Binataceae bacterium]|nr:hypothetical protein [Candidatus Binataceae bacterium]
MKLRLQVAVVLAITGLCSPAFAQFTATAVIDTPTSFYTPGAQSFPMGLYGGSNVLSQISAAHDAKLQATSASIVPICQNGRAPVGTCLEGGTGKIGLVELGPSVTMQQTCTGLAQAGGVTALPQNCVAGTANQVFWQDQQGPNPTVNPAVAFADCAYQGAGPEQYVQAYPSGTLWTNCESEVTNNGLVDRQVEAAVMEVVAGGNTSMADLTTPMCTSAQNQLAVCFAENKTGILIRDLKKKFPNLKIMYLYSRAYAGWNWPQDPPNNEPWAYESAWSVQFLIRAQITQADNGGPQDSTAGDLLYSVAPVLSWGGYQWASANTPNSEGLVWPRSDFTADAVHYTTTGFPNSANTMIGFFLGTTTTGANHLAYTTWFRAQ